jgi:hypothetical protein
VFLRHLLNNDIAQLRAEAEVVDLVRKGMGVFILEEVLEVVHVQVAVREGLSGCDMKVTNHLIHSDATLKAASFLALLVEFFGVVFALALFYALAATEGP